jgi:hypothetical protein
METKKQVRHLTTTEILGAIHDYCLSQGAVHMAQLVDNVIVRVSAMEQELHLTATIG